MREPARHLQRHLCGVAVVLWACGALAGCQFNPVGEVTRCVATSDCPQGQRCVAQECVDPTTPRDMEPPDMRPDDMGPPDMGPPDMSGCAVDRDGDGYFSDETCPLARRDCDDDDRAQFPGAEETCNGEDDDCDGAIDEDGVCACMPGLMERCGTDVGECSFGMRTCSADGRWGSCEGGVMPVTEVCDGKDNDCDGQTDETFPGAGVDCRTGLVGRCGTGLLTCAGAKEVCTPMIMPEPEVCDDQDNDCDGQIDEDEDGTVLKRVCGTSCPNRAFQVCQSGVWSSCTVTDLEQCDGQDTNCDGHIDNDSRCLIRCGERGVINGTQVCTNTGPSCTLPPEICGDGVDNDCDGQTDESCATNPGTLGMIYIPGGSFLRGALSSDGLRQVDETPIAVIQLDAYLIDRTEVSRAAYSQCVAAGQCSPPDLDFVCLPQATSGGAGQRPVTCITAERARQYCAWLGKRLPTEAEWEKAARGPFRQTRIWPWGDTPDNTRGVFSCNGLTFDNCLQPVDSYPNGASPYGVLHMAGNAAEYVEDFYLSDFYSSASSKVDNPQQGFATQFGRVVRGGSFRQSSTYGRVTNRASQYNSSLNTSEIGFRCAMSAP